MEWHQSHRADPRGVPIADRHYNRQKIGSPQFAPPGRCFVLLTKAADALWISSWPFAMYVKHAWAGAWINSCFRNESDLLSSELIRQAVAATLWKWKEPPSLGMITFVDMQKVKRKRDFGRCYRKAGFELAKCPIHQTHDPHCASCAHQTKGGLLALQLPVHRMPEAKEPLEMNAVIR